MISEVVQEIVNQLSLKILYLEVTWFMTFGYLMHIFVVMILTRLPFITLVRSIFNLQITAVISSFIAAPVLAALSIIVSEKLSVCYTMWFMGQQVYIWFVIGMMFVSSYVLCKIFATVPCSKFRRLLIGVNAGVGVLGLFVFKAMNLLIIA